jgi:hypothetical protein
MYVDARLGNENGDSGQGQTTIGGHRQNNNEKVSQYDSLGISLRNFQRQNS